jgi:hypothetical protein
MIRLPFHGSEIVSWFSRPTARADRRATLRRAPAAPREYSNYAKLAEHLRSFQTIFRSYVKLLSLTNPKSLTSSLLRDILGTFPQTGCGTDTQFNDRFLHQESRGSTGTKELGRYTRT